MKFAQIALRNLSRQKRRSLLLASAIAFGVMIVTAVNGFSAGTVRIIKENVADLIGGHVFIDVQRQVEGKTISYIEDDTRLVELLKTMGIPEDRMHRTVMLQGTFKIGSRETMARIVGTDWDSEKEMPARLGLPGSVVEALKADPAGLVISRLVADKLKLDVGDEIGVTGKTVFGAADRMDFTIKYITEDKSEVSGTMAFGSRSAIASFVQLPEGAYQTLRVRLGSLEEATPFAMLLKSRITELYPLAEEDSGGMGMNMDSNVFQMGREEKDFEGLQVRITDINSMLSFFNTISGGLALASFIMLVILLAITMIGIYNTFRMILYERTQEIGTMRAVGMLRKHVKRIFLLEALFLALLGVGLGAVLAAGVMSLLSLFNFGTEGAVAMILQNGHLSFTLDFGSLVVSILLVSFFTVLAAWAPARKAAKLAPADALRTNY